MKYLINIFTPLQFELRHKKGVRKKMKNRRKRRSVTEDDLLKAIKNYNELKAKMRMARKDLCISLNRL